MNKKRIKLSLVDRVFLSVDHVIMALLLIVTLYPLLYVVVACEAVTFPLAEIALDGGVVL